MVPMSANLFGPTSSKRIGKVSVNTLLPSVNSLAAQWGTCSIAFFASSSSLIEEAAPAFVLVVFLSRLPLVLLLSFLLLLFGMNDDGEDDDEVEEVIMQRVEGAVVIEEVKLIFFLSFCDDEFKFSPLFLFGAASKREHFYSLNGSRRTVSKRADSWAFVFFFFLLEDEDDEEEKESQTKSVPRVKEECVLSSCASKL